MNIEQARAELGELVARAERGERIAIELDGRRVCSLVPISDVETLGELDAIERQAAEDFDLEDEQTADSGWGGLDR